jgi:hypothetical protein
MRLPLTRIAKATPRVERTRNVKLGFQVFFVNRLMYNMKNLSQNRKLIETTQKVFFVNSLMYKMMNLSQNRKLIETTKKVFFVNSLMYDEKKINRKLLEA